jgi:hypothetical protein
MRPFNIGQRTMPSRQRTSALVLLASLTLAGSCVDLVGPDGLPPQRPAASPGTLTGGDTPTSPSDSTPAPPVITAVLRIVVSTTGADLDPDGYTVSLMSRPDRAPTPIGDSGSVEMRLPVGTYVVGLKGLAGNCAVEAVAWWGTLREVGLWADREVTLDVACERVPSARLAPGEQLAFVRDGQIWRVSSDVTDAVQLTSGPGDSGPVWSPDGQRIAFARQDWSGASGASPSGIFVMDADGSNVVRLSDGPFDSSPTWSPDGRRIAYASLCSGSGCVLVGSVDPADTRRTRIGSAPAGAVGSPAWSPDGARIAFTSDWAFYDDASDVYLADLVSPAITQLTSLGPPSDHTRTMYYAPAWSPDGARLSVNRCLDGYLICDVGALAVMNADGTGERVLARTRGSAGSAWSPDGRTIAFANGGNVEWISADGSARGIIVENGVAPAWRPK